MFPLVAITGAPVDAAIAVWGLVRLGLGLAIRAQAEAGQVAAQPAGYSQM